MKLTNYFAWFMVVLFSITRGDPVGIFLGILGVVFMDTMIENLSKK